MIITSHVFFLALYYKSSASARVHVQVGWLNQGRAMVQGQSFFCLCVYVCVAGVQREEVNEGL